MYSQPSAPPYPVLQPIDEETPVIAYYDPQPQIVYVQAPPPPPQQDLCLPFLSLLMCCCCLDICFFH